VLPKCFLDQRLSRRSEADHAVSPVGRMRVAPDQASLFQAIEGDTHRTGGQTDPVRDFRNGLWTFVQEDLERPEIGETETELHNALVRMARERAMRLREYKPDMDSAGIGRNRK